MSYIEGVPGKEREQVPLPLGNCGYANLRAEGCGRALWVLHVVFGVYLSNSCYLETRKVQSRPADKYPNVRCP